MEAIVALLIGGFFLVFTGPAIMISLANEKQKKQKRLLMKRYPHRAAEIHHAMKAEEARLLKANQQYSAELTKMLDFPMPRKRRGFRLGAAACRSFRFARWLAK